jgi:ribosomal protein S17E
VNRNPTLFSGDFEKNKQALGGIAVIHNRSLRNQLAGAITKIIKANSPGAVESQEQEAEAGASSGDSGPILSQPVENVHDSSKAGLNAAQEPSKDNTIEA